MDDFIKWKVSFHDEFDPEFEAFSEDVQNELLAVALAVQQLGPTADRPHVGTLKNPRHPNMKELRFKANHGAEVWRAAFAFDTHREAIILVAADKQGVDEKKFYKDLLKKANERFDKHLKNLKPTDVTRSPSKKGRK
ncbi:MAG: type II toxin-antitoxin system RelE/ParE family toxin [Duganella sp.]